MYLIFFFNFWHSLAKAAAKNNPVGNSLLIWLIILSGLSEPVNFLCVIIIFPDILPNNLMKRLKKIGFALATLDT